jgi:hypothetical protein
VPSPSKDSSGADAGGHNKGPRHGREEAERGASEEQRPICRRRYRKWHDHSSRTSLSS